jgi:anthranilate synthase/aminodeoxychorismate synthase-like glutamine amidotransferase
MKKHVLLIDHYDSFTQLIKSYFEQLGARVTVMQSDALILESLDQLALTHVVLSPGPGHPEAAHATRAFILKYYQQYPMLGVCLGHQCLLMAFGGEMVEASEICHGKQSRIDYVSKGLFKTITSPFFATRYHSLVVSPDSVPDDWEVTAWCFDAKGSLIMMGVQHQTYKLFGVQFHPEAVLTVQGMQLFKNFLMI